MCSKPKTINEHELEKFDALSGQWWDESGPVRMLHRLNLTRLRYIKNLIKDHFKKDLSQSAPLKDIKILDAGCGGGLLTEPLFRMGASVHGIDPSEKNIEIARKHAHAFNLKIPYHNVSIEDLPNDKTYQVVIALEVMEHVNCPYHFLLECYKRLRPGGLLIISTLNRTIRSYLEAIISAEYILNWAPKGTHSWSQFHKPSELHHHMKKIGFYDVSFQGVSYTPLQDKWMLSDTLEVNYFAKAVK